MTPSVVDTLEVVDVEQHQRHRAAVALHAQQFALGELEEGAARPGAGQEVAVRVVLRLAHHLVVHHHHRTHREDRHHERADGEKRDVPDRGLGSGRQHFDVRGVRISEHSTNSITTLKPVIGRRLKGLSMESEDARYAAMCVLRYGCRRRRIQVVAQV
jgi:hypothetical protein